MTLQELGYPPNYVPEDPDFFLNPVERATYTYDAAGNRTTMTDDYGQVTYRYDAANRLIEADGETYSYDAKGNLTSRTTEHGPVNYAYNSDNQLTKVSYADQTYVQYDYDALGRKVYRQEQFYDLNGPGASMGGNNGAATGKDKNPNPGNGKGNAYGRDKNQGSEGTGGNGGVIKNYHLKQETTRYLYDGLALLNEYNGSDNELFAYYARGEQDQVISRKMFGFQGRKEQGYLGNLRDRGHQLFYHYDVTGNVTDLTDHTGSEVLKYRYDAFGGVFTQLWNPYNQVGLTGKTYDIKASLMDYSARWYSPANGRFTTQDTWPGYLDDPQSQNRYIYTVNNPLKYADPTGHIFCSIQIGDCDMSIEDPPPPATGGGSGGGGNPGDGGIFDPDDPDPIPDDELERIIREQIRQQRINDYSSSSGPIPLESMSRTEKLTMLYMLTASGQYNQNLSMEDNMEATGIYLKGWLGNYDDRMIQQAIGRQMEANERQQYCQSGPGLRTQECQFYNGMQLMIGVQGMQASGAGNLSPRTYHPPDPTPIQPDAKTRMLKPAAQPVGGTRTKYYNPNYVYNMSSTDMVLGAKNASKGLSTMGSARRADALEAGKAWVGPGAKPITNGNGEVIGYSSQNGLRAFRLQYKPNEGRVRANFTENTRNERTNGIKEVKNVHVDILEE
ncbi:hypothetical protein CBW65_02230 [Tumebacillus avium]|uniref:Teneurin-like YD-shell domain-containing protein n=1 Tax=Tumebacillus avium TaxID=1903704 RepID=A0A1Y0IHN8_9BACL|nr:RHS repeat-associated core domain-containing protein [Tumebacillus avium]ARU60012.1 hypothetical protein CBW65_02230 [Tumebacillus avium]